MKALMLIGFFVIWTGLATLAIAITAASGILARRRGDDWEAEHYADVAWITREEEVPDHVPDAWAEEYRP